MATGLSGQKVLVTGASSGIGAAIAQALAEEGCLVWGTTRNLAKVATLPESLRQKVKFLAMDSSKWSMADVMALAIFMSFVAFNGLIGSALSHLSETGADLLIPTDSSRVLPGYYLFIGFCLASLFLSKKLERGIQIGKDAQQAR